MPRHCLTKINPRWTVACATYAKSFDVAEAAEASGLDLQYLKNELSNPVVQAEINKYVQQITDKTIVDGAYLLQHLSDMVFADLGDIYDDNGNFKPIKRWPKIWRQMLHSFEAYPTGVPYKVKFIDKLQLIQLVGKHVQVNAFEERSRSVHEISDKLAELMEQAQRRVPSAPSNVIDHSTQQPIPGE